MYAENHSLGDWFKKPKEISAFAIGTRYVPEGIAGTDKRPKCESAHTWVIYSPCWGHRKRFAGDFQV